MHIAKECGREQPVDHGIVVIIPGHGKNAVKFLWGTTPPLANMETKQKTESVFWLLQLRRCRNGMKGKLNLITHFHLSIGRNEMLVDSREDSHSPMCAVARFQEGTCKKKQGGLCFLDLGWCYKACAMCLLWTELSQKKISSSHMQRTGFSMLRYSRRSGLLSRAHWIK